MKNESDRVSTRASFMDPSVDKVERNDGNDEFVCPYCDKTFTLKSSKKRHIKVFHSSNRKYYQCAYCPHKVFDEQYILKHLRISHPKKKRCYQTKRMKNKVRARAEDLKESKIGNDDVARMARDEKNKILNSQTNNDEKANYSSQKEQVSNVKEPSTVTIF